MSHVLLAEHPATGDVLVMTESAPRPLGGVVEFPIPCWVAGCRCDEQLTARPVSPQDAVAALALAADPARLAASVAASEPSRDHPEAPGVAQGGSDGVLSFPESWKSSPLALADDADPIANPGSVTEPRRAGSDPGVFEIHPSAGSTSSWRLRDQHGDVVARGEYYDSYDDARAAIAVTLAALGLDGGTAPQIVEVER